MNWEHRKTIVLAQERMKSMMHDFINAKLAYYRLLFEIEDAELSEWDKRVVGLIEKSLIDMQKILDETGVES